MQLAPSSSPFLQEAPVWIPESGLVPASGALGAPPLGIVFEGMGAFDGSGASTSSTRSRQAHSMRNGSVAKSTPNGVIGGLKWDVDSGMCRHQSLRIALNLLAIVGCDDGYDNAT